MIGLYTPRLCLIIFMEVVKMDTENYQLTRYRLEKISTDTAHILDALRDDPTAENYCREIWDAVAGLKTLVDNLSTIA